MLQLTSVLIGWCPGLCYILWLPPLGEGYLLWWPSFRYSHHPSYTLSGLSLTLINQHSKYYLEEIVTAPCLPNFNMCRRHLRILLICRLWFRKSGMGPEILCVWQFARECWHCLSEYHILSSKGLTSLKYSGTNSPLILTQHCEHHRPISHQLFGKCHTKDTYWPKYPKSL